MAQIPPIDERRLIDDFLSGGRVAAAAIDDWIDAVLREGFGSLRQDWDDLKQEAKVRIFQNLVAERFEHRSTFKTYVQRIVKYVCIDAARRAYRRRETSFAERNDPEPGSDRASGLEALLARNLIDKVLEGLSKADLALVELVIKEHRSYAEVARLLDVSEVAVKARVWRLKNRLLAKRRRLADPRRGSS